MKNLINRFFAFANISYTMFTVRSNVKDGRKSPQIKPSAIFLSLILMVLFKKHSFLKLDQFMRTDAPKRFPGRDKTVAVSDTTISRSLSTYFLGIVQVFFCKLCFPDGVVCDSLPVRLPFDISFTCLPIFADLHYHSRYQA